MSFVSPLATRPQHFLYLSLSPCMPIGLSVACEWERPELPVAPPNVSLACLVRPSVLVSFALPAIWISNGAPVTDEERFTCRIRTLLQFHHAYILLYITASVRYRISNIILMYFWQFSRHTPTTPRGALLLAEVSFHFGCMDSFVFTVSMKNRWIIKLPYFIDNLLTALLTHFHKIIKNLYL